MRAQISCDISFDIRIYCVSNVKCWCDPDTAAVQVVDGSIHSRHVDSSIYPASIAMPSRRCLLVVTCLQWVCCFFVHRYRYFPDRRGGVSGFGVPPSSTRRQQADDQGGRHVWGRGNQLGDNWVPPAAEPQGRDWSQLCQRRPAQLMKRGQNFLVIF